MKYPILTTAALLTFSLWSAASAEEIDGFLGNFKPGNVSGQQLWNFDEAGFPETPETLRWEGNAVSFDGWRLGSKAGYFMSAPNSLLAAGREKQITSSLTFEKPVKAAGFAVQFATGTIKVRFLDRNGEVLREFEQNGQGDPSGNGTWADYFVGFESPNEFGEIKRVEFIRSNLNTGSIPDYAIDDLTVVSGAEMPAITVPKPVAVDFSKLGGAHDRFVAPQRPAGDVTVNRQGDTFEFRNTVDGTAYCYTFDAAAGLPSLTAALNGGSAFPAGRGWTFELDGVPVAWHLRSARIDGTRVHLAYDWKAGARTLGVTVVATLSGGSFTAEFASQNGARNVRIASPQHTGILKLSDSRNTAMRAPDAVPFIGFAGDISLVAATGEFYSYFVDWTRSNSTAPYPEITYNSDAPLRETIAVTLADALPKVLPTIPNPVSPYREKIAGSVVMEFWYGSFAELTEILENADRYGMDDLIVLVHRWQNAGFDRKYPTILPPSPSRGGLESLRAAATTARRNGQTLALHENYKDFYPDSPEWNEADLLLKADGKPQSAWADSKEMAPSKMRKYSEPVMKRIRSEIGTNGCFLDVHSTHPAWWRVDFRPGVPNAGMMKGTLEPTNQLWQQARDIYQGPVFGESYALTSWLHTGNVDSVMGQSGYNNGLILDFLLLKIRPLATNHGAGYFERWNPRGYVADWQNCPLPAPEFARYSLQEVAYLTAPTIDDKIKHEIMPMATAYYQKRKLVRRLAPHAVTRLGYYTAADNRELASSEAVLLPKQDVVRIREEFADGSVLLANFADTAWKIDGREIAPLGFYAKGSDFEAETNCVDGVWFDYYNGPDGRYLNARNFDWMMEPKGTAAMGRGPEGAAPILANAGNAVVSKGGIVTDLAVSVEPEKSGAHRLRFFPRTQMGFVTLKSGGRNVVALDADGNVLNAPGDEVQFGTDGEITIRHRDPRVWSYRID